MKFILGSPVTSPAVECSKDREGWGPMSSERVAGWHVQPSKPVGGTRCQIYIWGEILNI